MKTKEMDKRDLNTMIWTNVKVLISLNFTCKTNQKYSNNIKYLSYKNILMLI